MTYITVYLALLLSCCAYALWRGGAPERWGAGLLLGAVVLSKALPAGWGRFLEVELGYLAVDTALLVSVCVLATRAQRYWPMFVAAILLDQVITHLLMFSPKLRPYSYSVSLAIWSFAKPPILAIATWRHLSRVSRWGSDPDWS